MNIVIATFGYLPYAHGGTENYVQDEVSIASKQGNRVTIISTLTSIPTDSTFFYEDDIIKVIRYYHNETLVYGIYVDIKYTWQLYDVNNEYLLNSYVKFTKKAEFNIIDILQFNCFTSAVNLNLYKALKINSKPFKFIYTVHTAFYCMKGTLVNTFTEKLCDVNLNARNCFSCYYSDRNINSSSLVKMMMSVNRLPLIGNAIIESTSKFANIKKLINSISELLKQADQFVVYSELYRNLLINLGVGENKIAVYRHGISSEFKFIGDASSKEHNSFLYSGRLMKLKGADVLLQAWLLTEDTKSKKLYIACPSISSSDIDSDLIAQIQSRSDVEFIVNPTKADLISLYHKVECVVIPSNATEIGPLVFHEAILAKCNIISSDNKGSVELSTYYNDSNAVKLFSMRDVDTLVKQITHFNYQEINLVEKTNTIESHFGSLLELYKREQ